MENNEERKGKTVSRARRRTERIVSAFLAALVVGGGAFGIYTLRHKKIQTVTALEETVPETVVTPVFVLRDEQCAQTNLSGYTVLFVQDGERVAGNAEIAARFPDAGSAQRYKNLMELRDEYERYAALSSGREYASMRVDALKSKSADKVCKFIEAAQLGNVSAARTCERDFLGQETALEIAVTGNLDLTAKVAELSQKVQAQEASIGSYQSVTTGIDSAGYFFSRTDGFEDMLSYADARDLTTEQIAYALREEPAQSTGSKVVRSHVWYVAAILDTQDADKLTVNESIVRISFPKAGVSDVRATVYALHPDGNGKCAAVFRCIEVSESLLRLRRTDARIVIAEKTGFRVPLSAVRYLDMDAYDEKGKWKVDENGKAEQEKTRCVFIRRGSLVSQRRLNVVYQGEDYVLSAPPGKSMPGKYVSRYDEIIIGGKDLHAGAYLPE